jgi:hypothetical protein
MKLLPPRQIFVLEEAIWLCKPSYDRASQLATDVLALCADCVCVVKPEKSAGRGNKRNKEYGGSSARPANDDACYSCERRDAERQKRLLSVRASSYFIVHGRVLGEQNDSPLLVTGRQIDALFRWAGPEC